MALKKMALGHLPIKFSLDGVKYMGVDIDFFYRGRYFPFRHNGVEYSSIYEFLKGDHSPDGVKSALLTQVEENPQLKALFKLTKGYILVDYIQSTSPIGMLRYRDKSSIVSLLNEVRDRVLINKGDITPMSMLRHMAKLKSIKGYSTMNKDELRAALKMDPLVEKEVKPISLGLRKYMGLKSDKPRPVILLALTNEGTTTIHVIPISKKVSLTNLKKEVENGLIAERYLDYIRYQTRETNEYTPMNNEVVTFIVSANI